MTFTAGNLFPFRSYFGVTEVKPAPGFEHWSPAWEVDNLPTELSLPLNQIMLIAVYVSFCDFDVDVKVFFEGQWLHLLKGFTNMVANCCYSAN